MISNNWDFVDEAVSEDKSKDQEEKLIGRKSSQAPISGRVDVKSHETLSKKFDSFKHKYVEEHWQPSDKQFSWVFAQVCPYQVEVVVFLHGLYGNYTCFFRQLEAIQRQKIRGISVTSRGYLKPLDWVHDFRGLLDQLNVRSCHIVVADATSKLVALFVETYPMAVKSVLMCLTSEELTQPSSAISRVFSVFQASTAFIPKIVLQLIDKRAIDVYLGGIPESSIESFESQNAEEFMQESTNRLDPSEISQRIKLHSVIRNASIAEIHCPFVSLISNIGQEKHSLIRSYLSNQPHIRFMPLRSSSRFPYLAEAEEFNLYLFLHLRSTGLHMAESATRRGAGSRG